VLCASALAAVGARAHAQFPESKLDLFLRPFLNATLVERVNRAPAVEMADEAVGRPLGSVIMLRREAGRPGTWVDVFVSLTARDVDAIQAVSGEVAVQAGSLVGARVPLAALASLAADSRVRYVQAARRLELYNDAAIQDIGAAPVRWRRGTRFLGTTGRRVIVGTFDTGIDWRHDDFRNPDGSTRLLYLWDLTTSGTPPGMVGGQNFNRGNECAAAQINAAACTERDIAGHGTHVAGIAAGDGSAGGTFQFAGVAPNADLVIVKGGDFSFSSLDVVEGVQYIFKRAEALGRPAVVNLSLGTSFGSHDGTAADEQALDSLSGPGRIVVIAAGNSGSNPTSLTTPATRLIHATRTVAAGDSAELTVNVPNYAPNAGGLNDFMLFNLWYDGRDSLTITVRRPNGTTFSRRTGELEDSSDNAQGRVYMDNASAGPAPQNGDREAEIEVYDGNAGQPPAPGMWRLTVRLDYRGGTGRFDVWNYATSFTLSGSQLVGADNGYLVGAPGNAARALTVGAHVTRVNWTSIAGNFQFIEREAIGDLATFSSSGPTRPVRDSLPSRQKPEITAPGKGIFSALSTNESPAPPGALIATDGLHTLNVGTSMSAPMVTGAVALMLELNPSLDPETARAILTTSARQDGFTTRSYAGFGGGVPNPSWGYGKLNVEPALAAVPASLTLTAGAGAPTAPLRLGENAAVAFRVAAATPQSVRLDTLFVGGEGTVSLPDVVTELALYRDSGGTGVIPSGPPLATVQAPFAGGAAARFGGLNLRVDPGGAVGLLLAARAGDRLRQGDRLTLRIEGAGGLELGSSRPATAFQPQPLEHTFGPADLLPAGQPFLISENPVRDGRVIFTYAGPPRLIALYNFAGLKVREFTSLPANRFEWDLLAESPRLPNGMYVLVFESQGQRLRERLMILTPSP
jgi:subtilase family protein